MGQLRLVGSDNLGQQQPLALLAYLSINGPKTRRHLATVFWPDAKQPLNNLSSALTRIRHRLPDSVTADGRTVAAAITTDVADLYQAIEQVDAASIVRLYEGHFFESADIRAMGLELEEWVFGTREALARAASGALLSAAEKVVGADRSAASAFARHAYEIGRTFWFTGDMWQRCHDLLVNEHSVIAEKVRIEAGELGFEIAAALSPPPPSTPVVNGLFGRSSELEALRSFVGDSPDEWLAIVGMGGVGKTALARTFVHELSQAEPARAGRWVSLTDVQDADRLPDAIASELGMAYTERADLVAGLRSLCSVDAPLTLVLDNLEQLAGCEEVLEEIAAIDGLTVIVTSRIETGHRRERALRIEGLATSQSADAGPALFTARVGAFGTSIDANTELVQQICDRVRGLPLAIELCAGWLRALPIEVLAESLATSYDIVDSSPHDTLESIESILNRSWELLDDEGARVLSELSLFDANFDYVDATAITQTALPVLVRLIDSSLVSRHDDELVLHPLVRSYAHARLVSGDEQARAAAESRFVEHFRGQMAEAAVLMRGPEAGKVAPTLAAGFGNYHAAWDLALKRHDWPAIRDMVDGVDQHLKSQSRQFLAAQLLADALDTVDPHAIGPDASPAAQIAFVAIGWRYALARMIQGHTDDAVSALRRCEERQAGQDRPGQMGVAYAKGHMAIFAGNYDEAAKRFDDAKSLDDASVDEWFLAEVDAGRALVALTVGDNDKGRTLLRSMLDKGRRLENPVTITSAYYFLGTLEFAEDPAKALVLLEEGCAVAARASMTHMGRKYATMVGRCHVKLGDADQAIAVFRDALNESEDEAHVVREPWVRVANQAGMGMAYASVGDRERATPWFVQALRAQVEHDDWPLLLETILEVCRLRVDTQASPCWIDLLGVVATHPATMWEWKRDVRELVALAGLDPASDLAEEFVDERIDVIAERTLALLHA